MDQIFDSIESGHQDEFLAYVGDVYFDSEEESKKYEDAARTGNLKVMKTLPKGIAKSEIAELITVAGNNSRLSIITYLLEDYGKGIRYPLVYVNPEEMSDKKIRKYLKAYKKG